MIIKLILICLSNSLFNFFIKMKNEKQTVFRFRFFHESEKRIKVLKIHRKNLLIMKFEFENYLDFVFFIELKAKTKYRILNFVFQFINKKNEMALWVLEFLIYSVFIILINKQSQWQPAVYLISRFSFLFIYV